MIYSYNECIKMLGTHYNLVKALKEKKLFKIKEGLYSNERNPRELEIFIKEHPDAIFTLDSAFYYFGISDVIPTRYYVATDKDSSKYSDSNIKQFFMNNGLVNVGKIEINYSGITLPIYNKERLLIELARYKNKIPFDQYKEIIKYYRDHIDEINISLLTDYIELFPKKRLITKIIQMEVL